MMAESKVMESEKPDALSNSPAAPTKSKLACHIGGIDKGVLTGAVFASATADLEEIVVLAGRRVIGRPAISWTDPTIAPNGENRKGTFRFDLRFLPPDLLVETKLKIEIRAQREPPATLAKLDVEIATLLPIGTIEKEKGRLEGFIDGTDGGLVRGWVWDPTSTGRRIKLHLFVEGIFCGIFEAAAPRPDLKATGRGDGGYGFIIPAEDFFAKSGAQLARVDLVTLEPEYWRVPFAPHAAPIARPWIPRMPRPRRIPETVHEFAALLTSSEPFPKKIYVLDRIEQKMPDAFSADYLLLGLEFLRIEMVKTGETIPSTLSGRLLVWWRQRLIRGQISRLAALADAAAASKSLLDTASPTPSAISFSGERRERH